jgi:hypothetical protein
MTRAEMLKEAARMTQLAALLIGTVDRERGGQLTSQAWAELEAALKSIRRINPYLEPGEKE